MSLDVKFNLHVTFNDHSTAQCVLEICPFCLVRNSYKAMFGHLLQNIYISFIHFAGIDTQK